MNTPLVALVGRPNVGKSTLFNRLVGERQAIEEKTPGVTRDRIFGRAEWLNMEFSVVDTGGLTFKEDESLEKQVQLQTRLAMEEATVIVFLLDGRQGITALDEEIANELRRQENPVVLVANKVESRELSVAEFFKLGLGEPLPVSAEHGLNTGDLLDAIVSFFPPKESKEKIFEDVMRIAVVGRPNVGKSSIINALLGQERVIVDSEPGTTRDSIDTMVEINSQRYMLVDTAGIRRKSKIKENIEFYSTLRSLKAIDKADVVLFLLEAQEKVTEQDKRVAGYILESGKAMVIALNKWDLVKEERKVDGGKKIKEEAREALKFVSFAPLVVTSIHEPKHFHKLFNIFQDVYANYTMRIATPILNDLLADAQAINPLPSYKGKSGKIYYCTQPHIKPPSFVLFVNDTSLIHFSYLRYLENRLREAFGFQGTPIRLLVRTRKRKGED